ncbi:putative membrane protein [Paenibacillus riograndensis SBR5]|uniref:Putative membrane protein n=1 Tax=Paenibacillus riograndensis SBR5 TaxID=1073571 RepID=A0A0E4CUG1_9BACL|nr:putative membrane protein [Paenibacillus riograndensis SBR5]
MNAGMYSGIILIFLVQADAIQLIFGIRFCLRAYFVNCPLKPTNPEHIH